MNVSESNHCMEKGGTLSTSEIAKHSTTTNMIILEHTEPLSASHPTTLEASTIESKT